MGVADEKLDGGVIRMNDKVEPMAGTMKTQQDKIENLTERVIRLETALEIALSRQGGGDHGPHLENKARSER